MAPWTPLPFCRQGDLEASPDLKCGDMESNGHRYSARGAILMDRSAYSGWPQPIGSSSGCTSCPLCSFHPWHWPERWTWLFCLPEAAYLVGAAWGMCMNVGHLHLQRDGAPVATPQSRTPGHCSSVLTGAAPGGPVRDGHCRMAGLGEGRQSQLRCRCGTVGGGVLSCCRLRG